MRSPIFETGALLPRHLLEAESVFPLAGPFVSAAEGPLALR